LVLSFRVELSDNGRIIHARGKKEEQGIRVILPTSKRVNFERWREHKNLRRGRGKKGERDRY